MAGQPVNAAAGPVVRICAWLALIVVTCAWASCPKGPEYVLDTRFSVNLVHPSQQWPDLERMTPAQIEAYEKFGKPDYFRIWYNKRGEIANSREAGTYLRAKRLGQLPRSWIYEDKNIEIRFLSAAKFEKLPLSDKLRVLCLRGDPQARDVQALKDGSIRESWTYYDVGEKYIFVNDRLAKKQVFKGLGRPFQRM